MVKGSIEFSGLIYTWAGWEGRGTSPGEGDKFDTVSCRSLWICCIILYHMQCSAARPPQWGWGELCGSLMDYGTSSVPLMGMSYGCDLPGVGGFIAEAVCVREDGSMMCWEFSTHPQSGAWLWSSSVLFHMQSQAARILLVGQTNLQSMLQETVRYW